MPAFRSLLFRPLNKRDKTERVADFAVKLADFDPAHGE